MTWSHPPTSVTNMRTMLQACASWTAAGGAQAQIHYPDTTDTTFPRAIINAESTYQSAGTGIALRQDAIEIELQAWGRYKDAITAVSTGSSQFTISGDQTSRLSADDEIRVDGSTGNDRWYTIASVTLNAGNTDIVVNETVADSTADGSIYSGSLEDWADQICSDLIDQDTGLAITEARRVGLANWPTADHITTNTNDNNDATDDFGAVVIAVNAGLESST